MSTYQLQEITNPAAVGWEWGQEYREEGFEGIYWHQISWTRGSNQLHYGSKAPGRKNWTNTLIVAPERFGFDGTLEGARKAAQRFYDESEVKA